MEQPITQQFEAQAEEFENSAEQSYEEEFYEYFDDYEYEQDQEEEADEAEAYDFAIQNKVMKTKKFKAVNQVEEAEEEVAEEEAAKCQSTVFKGADKIYNQIMWDEKLNKNDFIVGYVDRFEGLLEEPFSVFEILKEDIPFHRIRFFKKGNEIVWDRKKKLNKL